MPNIEEVIEKCRVERVYQKLRWGERQSDGSLKEVSKPYSEFVCYMHHHLRKAIQELTEKAGRWPALDELRKVVCLAIACLEQEHVDIWAKMLKPKPVEDSAGHDVGFYLMAIDTSLHDAAGFLWSRDSVLDTLEQIVEIGVECFCRFGIEGRTANAFITNHRDGNTYSLEEALTCATST